MMSALILALLCGLTLADDKLNVPTTSGTIHGMLSTVRNRTARVFLGVPYAEAPIGNLRFKPPVAVNYTGTVIETTNFAPSCYQPPHYSPVISPLLKPNKVEVSEDCLYLNIYVPELSSEKPLPVAVFFTGEGFNYADPAQYDGRFFAADSECILVTVNYRLGVFGFFSTQSENAPGNVGLLDQRMALKWVKRNIGNFGGDIHNVALWGRFTGAMSAGIHAFSPLSKKENLFDKVILQSGIAVEDWALDKDPLNATKEIAKKTDCEHSELDKVTECLRKVPADILQKSALSVPVVWRPTYDNYLIFDDTLVAAAKGNYAKVDTLIGFNVHEGTLCTIGLNAMKSPFYEKIVSDTLDENDFEALAEDNLLARFRFPNSLVSKLAVFEYEEKSKLRENFMNFCSEMYVKSPSQKLGDIISSNNGNVYMYELEHRPSFSIQPAFVSAAHGDDVLYSMALPFQLENLSPEEAELTNQMVKAFSSFIHRGNPNHDTINPIWPSYTIERKQIMEFGSPSESRASPYTRAVRFWESIIPAVQKQNCSHPSPVINFAALTDSRMEVPEQARFLGSSISIPAAENALLTLLCASGFLFVTAVAAIAILYKVKNYSTFHRL